jgi:hypothetical protein
MSERFTNARVHEWLTAALDAASGQMQATRLTMNSAALWWFLTRPTPEEWAEVLGEYLKALAMQGHQEGGAGPAPTGKGKTTK